MDATIENNFRYHAPNAEQVQKYQALRDGAKELAYLIKENCPASREASSAMTNLEIAVMWANAAIARNGSALQSLVTGSSGSHSAATPN